MARHFKNWIKAYVDHTRFSESPTPFHFWTAVSTVAGALRRRVWIDERHFQWTPNFYIVLVGPPGVAAKSTSVRIGMSLLRKVDGIHFGPKSATWQAMTAALQRAEGYIEQDDGSGDLLRIPMSCITIPITELGTFFKMEDTAMMDVLVDLWDGQLEDWGHETRTQDPILIKNPWINIIGCTTPSWIQQHIKEDMIGGGLISRMIFVFGDRKRHLVAYPSEQVLGKDYTNRQGKLTRDLQEIALLQGPYKVNQEAIEWGTNWYDELWNKPRPVHLASHRYNAYISRKQTHVHKLAMVLAAARSNELTITLEILSEAVDLITSIEPDMNQVFEAIGVVDQARHTTELTSYVSTYKFLTPDKLWSLVQNIMPLRDFEVAVKAAVKSGNFMVVTRKGERGLIVNPHREEPPHANEPTTN